MKAINGSAGDVLKVMPPEDWDVQSPFGVLKTNTGQSGQCLVRLEDVHAHLMRRDGMASANAAAHVFAAFMSDAGSSIGMQHGAAKVRACLHVVDQADYAATITSLAGRMFIDRMATLPYLQHHRLERGTVEAAFYALSVIAGEVWAPHAKDVQLVERVQGYFPEDVLPALVVLREMVGRLAVPFAVAYELWGWGSVAAAVALPDVLPSATVAPVIEVQDVTDWPSLVRYRQQFVHFTGAKEVQKRAVWVDEHVAQLAARLNEEYLAGRWRGALGRLAGELGIARSTAGELLKKRGFNQATGEKQQAPATPWSGAGGRGGKAA